ncbi:hypothetical protein [Caulobacter sp. BP25]|uniref:hypothetical protein n=1 Tax=Caulobacter sp. BP25 TaxID=2048900 RepID=UPI000C12A6EE|nr:hypothetical protein [Caulobacter sp. BP25]PHY20935.1 hypothetical protein CSW59_06925 [Caulobacter sp. BP25]
MSTKTADASAEQGLALEKLRLLETYFQTREQEDALRESRSQIAGRLNQISAELRVIDAGRAAPKGDA